MTFTLAIHGGAGTIPHSSMTPEAEAGYRAGLRTALLAGHAVLAQGGTALDAVTRAVMALEDDEHFNAGRGAVFTTAGEMEMDAALMDGRTRACGAVTGIIGPRNPILAARAVMERSDAVLLHGPGALAFLHTQDLVFEDPAYFHTERRHRALLAELARRKAGGEDRRSDADRHGTVGAVARDSAGNLAAATSTGGMTGKRPGRIGDTPLFGAGTWAENGACAVSATGHGESFIRHAAAHEVAARIRLAGQSLADAAATVITELHQANGSGGLIAVGRDGPATLPFNSEGMYRGTIGPDATPRTAIYAGEPTA